jgi:LuxR family transcriptional regulator
MDRWQEEQLHTLLTAQNEQEYFSALSGAANQLGFERCAFGMRLPLPVTNPGFILHTNYAQAWRDRYVQNNYLLIDPTVAHGMRSIRPLVWDEPLFAQTPEFWEEARSHGLKVGWAQASHSAQGVGSMLTLARSHDALSARELAASGAHMTWLAQLAHEGFARFVLPAHLPEAFAELSGREAEVLRWTAEGKTSGEIGYILGIATGTVNYHLSNAIEKLGASNRTAAAIKAVTLGLI